MDEYLDLDIISLQIENLKEDIERGFHFIEDNFISQKLLTSKSRILSSLSSQEYMSITPPENKSDCYGIRASEYSNYCLYSQQMECTQISGPNVDRGRDRIGLVPSSIRTSLIEDDHFSLYLDKIDQHLCPFLSSTMIDDPSTANESWGEAEQEEEEVGNRNDEEPLHLDNNQNNINKKASFKPDRQSFCQEQEKKNLLSAHFFDINSNTTDIRKSVEYYTFYKMFVDRLMSPSSCSLLNLFRQGKFTLINTYLDPIRGSIQSAMKGVKISNHSHSSLSNEQDVDNNELSINHDEFASESESELETVTNGNEYDPSKLAGIRLGHGQRNKIKKLREYVRRLMEELEEAFEKHPYWFYYFREESNFKLERKADTDNLKNVQMNYSEIDKKIFKQYFLNFLERFFFSQSEKLSCNYANYKLGSLVLEEEKSYRKHLYHQNQLQEKLQILQQESVIFPIQAGACGKQMATKDTKINDYFPISSFRPSKYSIKIFAFDFMVECKKTHEEATHSNSTLLPSNYFIKYLLSSQTIILMAIEELVLMDNFILPQDKLKCIERSCQVIINALESFRSSKEFMLIGRKIHHTSYQKENDQRIEDQEGNIFDNAFGADEFLPAYILVVLNLLLNHPTIAKTKKRSSRDDTKANGEGMFINSIYAEIAYINHYHHENGLRGRQGYYLTCFESAVEFIRLYEIENKNETDQQ